MLNASMKKIINGRKKQQRKQLLPVVSLLIFLMIFGAFFQGAFFIGQSQKASAQDLCSSDIDVVFNN